MGFVPDNLDAFDRYDARQEALLDRLPKCAECNEPIQDDDLYDLDGALYCEDCMKKLFKKRTENYMEE